MTAWRDFATMLSRGKAFEALQEPVLLGLALFISMALSQSAEADVHEGGVIGKNVCTGHLEPPRSF